ncbi:MAG: Do family serine endopeptidase, partial [Treponema sp.]|nr:Do family serine endopeptidase [Treponema sp.]
MNLVKKLSSRNFFIFNLVLIGVIFGFSLAFLSFSCSTPQAKNAKAQESPGRSSPAIASQDAIAMAEGLQNVFRSVADKVLPSVVEIKTVSVQRRQSPNFNGIPWDFFFGPRDGSPRQPDQEREFRSQGLGSGIIVRRKSNLYYVLTNYHVVNEANEIIVASNAGKEYPAELVGKIERRDLAVISFKTGDDFPLADLGNSDDVRVGDWAIAVGNPLGFMSSVTMGIVSAVGRTGGPGGNINDFIQTDTSINQGNSGGALVNIRGEVIGINTWIASTSGASVGLGFAIPINNAKRIVDEFINEGSVRDGWLGVSLIEADKDMLESLGVEGKRGALASQVFLDSPADKGGIRPGDFITHVDGREARGVNQLTMMVGDLRPGQKAVFTAIRDRAVREFTVLIEPRTDEVAAANKKLWPGVHVAAINDALRNSLKLDKDVQGLVVVNIVPESPAAVVGIQRGDRITAVNDTPVKDLESFYRVLREKTGRELWFSFVRSDTTL